MKYKIKNFFIILLTLTILVPAQYFSGNILIAKAGDSSVVNISKNTDYMFSYRSAMNLTADDLSRDLTKDYGGKPNTNPTFVSIKNDSRTYTDWWDKASDVNLFEEKDPFFYIKNDLGFVAEVHNTSISFAQGRNIQQPQSVEVYYSNDGYNYSFYGGRLVPSAGANGTVKYSITFPSPVLAKAIKYVVYAPVGFELAVSGIESQGKKLNERVLLSKGASYTIDAEVSTKDWSKLLTDNAFGELEESEKYCDVSSIKKDALHNTDAQYYTLDLGAVKNISEIQVSSLVDSNAGTIPIKYIRTEVSTDGKNYQDFCVAPAYNRVGRSITFKEYFKAARNHTVQGRFVRVSVFVTGFAAIDEISVFGSNSPVAEPKYNFAQTQVTGQSDIARDKAVTANSANLGTAITDGKFRTDSALVKSIEVTPASKKIQLNLDLGKNEANLAGLELSFEEKYSGNIKSITAYSSLNGSSYTKIGEFDKGFALANLKTYRKDINLEARYLRFEIETTDNKAVNISQLQVFSKISQRPIIRGGWYSYYMNSTDNSALYYKYDEYMMYIALKGFKELGMDYVIGPAVIEYKTKLTLDEPSAHFKALGYKKGVGRGVENFYTALFNAADKLDMRVYMGAISCENFPQITETRIPYYQKVLAETVPIFKEYYDKHKNHKSFVGVYFSEETCDQWLAESNDQGTKDFRVFYKGQSDAVRALDEKLETVIAPAIWRAGTPARLETNIYNLLKAESGERPIIDIVSAQDCLGRLPGILVDDGTYSTYELYLRALSAGTVKAKAKYFSDIELFDVHYRSKRFTEVIDALNLHSRYTDGNLIFDIINYISPYTGGSFNSFLSFDREHLQQQYIKYLQNGAAEINDIRFSGKVVKLKIVNSDNEDFTKKLAGTVFKLVNSKNKLVGTLTTDNKGEAVIDYTKLLGTKLTLVQTQVNSSYLRQAVDLTLNITRESMFEKDAAGFTYVLNIGNNKKGASINLSAVDSQDEDIPINGAVFNILNSSGNVVETVTTGSNGNVDSKTLQFGKYTIRQTKTAVNYKVNAQIATVTLSRDGQRVQVVYKNHNTLKVDEGTPDPEPEIIDGDEWDDDEDEEDEEITSDESSSSKKEEDKTKPAANTKRKEIVEYETVIDTMLIIILSCAGVIIIGGGITAIILIRRKKKKSINKEE